MAVSVRDSENERERRRGWYMMIGFFTLLFGGCGLYWIYLTYNAPTGPAPGVKIASASAPLERRAAPEPVIDPAPEPEPEALVPAATIEPERVTLELPPEPEPVPKPEPEPVAEHLPVVEETPPPRVFEDTRWLTTASIRGEDRSGHGANFDIHVLAGGTAWVFGETARMDVRGEEAPASALFETQGLGEAYCGQSAMIALGAASFEGEETLNHRLASGRGKALTGAIAAAAPTCDAAPKRLVANLGEHTQSMVCPGNAERCPEVSAFQRPVVIISARADTDEVDYGAALKNAIEVHEAAGRQIFPRFKLGDYSQFEVGL